MLRIFKLFIKVRMKLQYPIETQELNPPLKLALECSLGTLKGAVNSGDAPRCGDVPRLGDVPRDPLIWRELNDAEQGIETFLWRAFMAALCPENGLGLGGAPSKVGVILFKYLGGGDTTSFGVEPEIRPEPGVSPCWGEETPQYVEFSGSVGEGIPSNMISNLGLI